jgi:hypothetical protein
VAKPAKKADPGKAAWFRYDPVVDMAAFEDWLRANLRDDMAEATAQNIEGTCTSIARVVQRVVADLKPEKVVMRYLRVPSEDVFVEQVRAYEEEKAAAEIATLKAIVAEYKRHKDANATNSP